jgi:hypothetical protein
MTCAIALLIMAHGAAGPDWQDEGIVSLGGAPRLLAGERTVRLLSQSVAMTVGERLVDVDATFELRNEGATGYFRVGFPEIGVGVTDNPATFRAFDFFSLFVDSQAVETAREAGYGTRAFRTKLVRLVGGQVHELRVLYRVPLGTLNMAAGGQMLQTGFDFPPPTSWRGTIAKTEIVVRWQNERVERPVIPMALAWVGQKTAGDSSLLTKMTANNVFFRALPRGTRMGPDTLRFSRAEFVPSETDGFRMYFGYRPRR